MAAAAAFLAERSKGGRGCLLVTCPGNLDELLRELMGPLGSLLELVRLLPDRRQGVGRSLGAAWGNSSGVYSAASAMAWAWKAMCLVSSGVSVRMN